MLNALEITRLQDQATVRWHQDESWPDPLTLAQLKDKLQQLKSDNPDLSVVVKGDDNVDYQNMVSVLDVLQQLDITKVGLATQEAASP